MKPEIIQRIFAKLSQAIPEPKTELQYRNNFELLIAVMLSAQSTDKGVNRVTPALFAAGPTPEAMFNLGVEGVMPLIQTLGLYRSKAKHVVATCERLFKDFNNEIPQDRAALESLPGVGRKTANVILNTAFKQETFAVDTHIFRVCNRTGLAPGKTPLAVEKKLEAIVPALYRKDAHHYLILHGRYVCQARKPLCEECVIREECDYYRSLDTSIGK